MSTTSSTHKSSPTSYGVSPVILVEGEISTAYHRRTLSTTTVTTPVFSPTALKEDDRASLRTLDNVRDQVAASVAVRLMRKLKTADNTQYGVALTLSKSNNDGSGAFLRLVASHLATGPALKDKAYLIAVATTGAGDTSLLICGTDPAKVQRAALLTTSKFIGHIKPLPGQDRDDDHRSSAGASVGAGAGASASGASTGTVWLARVRGLAWNGYDEAALLDVLQKCAQELVDPSRPPPGSSGIDELIEISRTRLHRLLPRQALAELRDADIRVPVVLVDIRPPSYRDKYGIIPGAIIVERMVLEWKFDPRCVEERLDIATRYDLRVIVICHQGLASSLAAAALQDIGLLNATDIVGGFMAWKDEGLPTELDP